MSDVSPSRRIAITALAMASLGAVAGFGLGKWLKLARADAVFPALADACSLGLGALLIAQGLWIAAVSLYPRLSGQVFSGEPDRAARPAQLSFYRLQAGVLLLAGAMLSAPTLVTLLLAAPPPHSVATAVMAGIALAFSIQTALNVMIWRRADEFVRRLLSESSAICFWVLQAAYFLWAAAVKLALVPPLDMWGGVAILMGVYVIAASYVSVRNGVTQ